VVIVHGSFNVLRSLGSCPAVLAAGIPKSARVDRIYSERFGWTPGEWYSVLFFEFLGGGLVAMGDPSPGHRSRELDRGRSPRAVAWQGHETRPKKLRHLSTFSQRGKMSPSAPSIRLARRAVSRFQVRTWSLILVVLFVAIAIVNIQDQRRNEPALIALASVGFMAYGLLGCMLWRFLHRFEAWLGGMLSLIVYLVAMAALFLLATVVYLVLEHAYLRGYFS
jgi:hypothetical protein